MPAPLAGFDAVNDPQTDSLGWHVPLNLQSFGGLLDVTNQTDLDFELWANDTDYLGMIPAWTAYVKINFHGLYTYVNFRPHGQLYAQSVVSETVGGSLYQLGEPSPSTVTIALPRQSQPIRQVRTIAVPIALEQFYTGSVTLTAGLVQTIVTFTPSADQLKTGNRIMPVYLYAASIHAATAAAVTTNAFAISMQWRDGGGVAVGGPFDLVLGRVAVSTTAGDHWYSGNVQPIGALGTMPAGVATCDIQLRVIASNGNNSAQYNIVVNADTLNLYGNGDIGYPVGRWSPAVFEAVGKPYPLF